MQQSEGDQGGDDGDEEEAEDSIKIVLDPNWLDKLKSPEAKEVTKPQFQKKMKASKDKNIDKEITLTTEELDQALTKSTKFLTKKWSEFAATHLDALIGIARGISELKELAEKSATGAAANSTPVSAQPDTRQWPVRENRGQVSSAFLIITDTASRSEMSMIVGIDYTKMSMMELHLYQLAIMKEIQARDHYSQIQLEKYHEAE